MIGVCCKALKQNLLTGQMLHIMTNVPFQLDTIEPTLFILSDGGHAGWIRASYCPFCGTKIENKPAVKTKRKLKK